MENHKTIYLEPICPDCVDSEGWPFGDEGRTWCSNHNNWEYDCPVCGKDMDIIKYNLVEG